MFKNLVMAICLVSVLSPGLALAETMQQCMQRKLAEGTDRRTEKIFSNSGCETKATGLDGVRHSCNRSLCWDAPPGRTIVDATVADTSARGSEHSFNGPHYQPDRDRAIRVCVNVHARSPHGHAVGRGWQNVDVTVTTTRQYTNDEMVGIAVACSKEGAN